MSKSLKGALVVEDDELIGVVSFKDILTRAVAQELPFETTEISSVMTPYPEIVLADATVIEALQVMLSGASDFDRCLRHGVCS